MIGGCDMVLAGSGPPDEGVFLVSVLHRIWPDLVVQDASADDVVTPEDPSIANITEFFAYRSLADFRSWAADGASDANGDTMIHAILGPKSTTFVTEAAGSETYRHALVLRRELTVHRVVTELDAMRAPIRARPPEHPPQRLDRVDRPVFRGERRLPTEHMAGA